MAQHKYPTAGEIEAEFTTEQIAEVVANLSSWDKSPITLAELNVTDNVSPGILYTWAALTEAIETQFPDAVISVNKVTRPLSGKELYQKGITHIRNARYNNPEWMPGDAGK